MNFFRHACLYLLLLLVEEEHVAIASNIEHGLVDMVSIAFCLKAYRVLYVEWVIAMIPTLLGISPKWDDAKFLGISGRVWFLFSQYSKAVFAESKLVRLYRLSRTSFRGLICFELVEILIHCVVLPLHLRIFCFVLWLDELDCDEALEDIGIGNTLHVSFLHICEGYTPIMLQIKLIMDVLDEIFGWLLRLDPLVKVLVEEVFIHLLAEVEFLEKLCRFCLGQ